MRKYKLISALAEETAKEVVRNEESWRRYLNTASRLYKYPFKEQLLIYAQRPDATACASIEIWNEKMHCWVNKGAKVIALIDEDSFSGLKYVFDISDVHKARRIGQFPNLWEMREEHMEAVISRLEDLEEKWGKKYPASIGSWRNNWPQLSTYFKYPSEIRKLIYTTNSIENFNRQLRKVTKSKTIFPTDDALFKMLYLAMMDATKKWTGKAWDWGLTLDQLCIYFGDRIQPEDID